MERTVEISIADSSAERIRSRKFQEAIGYAILWGNSDKVVVFVDKDLVIGVSHQRKVSPGKYTQYFYMEGHWDTNAQSYFFHS